MINTIERWRFNAFAGAGTANDAIPVGPREPLPVPAEARNHYIWIAGGASFQETLDRWWVVGRIEFYLGSQKQGHFQFTDHSRDISTAERDAAPRQLVRIRGDASGSTQPVLRWQDQNNPAASTARDNLDIAAFCFEVRCDRIIYVMERNYYRIDAASPSLLIHFVTGLRVLSM